MEFLDFAVVGGGPAGLSAALVAHGNRLRTLLLERGDTLGGQVRDLDHPIADFLGRPVDRGTELAQAFAQQAVALELPTRLSTSVESISWRPDGRFELSLGAGPMLLARAVLVATGTGPRSIGLVGEDQYGLHDRARLLAPQLAGQPVVVIGGGDEAAETARWLAESGASVTLLVRHELRARPLIRKALLDTPRVRILKGEEVVELLGDGRNLQAVRLRSGATLPAVHCFTRIGVETRAPRIEPDPRREPDGRISVDAYGRTSIPRLYAAGDLIVTGDRRYISVATGTGAIVGRAVEGDLEGSTPAAPATGD